MRKYTFIGFIFHCGIVVTWKIIQVDLYNKSTHRVIFSQCGGLSLRIYLSRTDDIYQKSVWQYMRYCLKVDKPILYSYNTMTLVRYESNENKCICCRLVDNLYAFITKNNFIIVNLVNMRLIDWETS